MPKPRKERRFRPCSGEIDPLGNRSAAERSFATRRFPINGWSPSTFRSNLEAAGLSGGGNGRLAVDEKFPTAGPPIFGARRLLRHPRLAATSSGQGPPPP